ncbi:MAG: hypothetical protein P8J33_11800, partial [Pirellulaceae bacterium]|nr:hypothetical protein [Pirellulaceae bacterium]
SGPDPELYVNETGKITKAIGVTVGGLAKDDFVTASEVFIDPITNQYAYEEGSFQTFNGDGNNVTINTTDTKSLKDGSVVTLIDASNPQLNSTFVIQSVVENTSFNLVGAKGINGTGTNGSWVTGGAVTFDTKTIVGDHGTISSATAFQKITLENESPKTMVLNDITVTAPSATPTVKVFAEQWNAFQFEIGHQVPPTAIDITHAPDGATPSLILNGIINNSYGDTHLTSNGQLINSTPTMGNWASTGEKGIITRTLDVNTQAAAGALNDSLRVDLVRTTGNTDFELSAADGIYLDLGSRYIGTDSTQAIFEGGTIETSSDNADLDLFIRSTTQDLPSSPSSSNSAPVNFFVNNVSTPLSVNQLSFPTYTNHPIAGTYEFKNLIAGSLNGNVDIVSENNSDGDANKIVHFHSGIDIGKQGELFASSNGNLSLFEANDDLRIRNVTSSFGDVLLAAEGVDGSIYDLDTTETSPYGVTAWVTGNSVTLQTRHGGIGTDDDFLEINSSNSQTGGVIALATDGVYLTETTGGISVDQLLSRTNDIVLLTQSGSITEYSDDAQADIQGSNLDLIIENFEAPTAHGYSIGEPGNPIELLGAGTNQQISAGYEIERFVPATGRLVANAGDGIHLTETSGALHVLDVQSHTADVALMVLDSISAGEDLTLLEQGGTTFFGNT